MELGFVAGSPDHQNVRYDDQGKGEGKRVGDRILRWTQANQKRQTGGVVVFRGPREVGGFCQSPRLVSYLPLFSKLGFLPKSLLPS